MFGWDDAISAGGTLLGGLFGAGESARARRRAREAYQNAIGVMQGADVEGDNAWADAIEDPTGRAAQLRALAGFQDVADQRGMDTQSRVALQQALGETMMAEKAQRDAVLQGMAARGAATGGDALAAGLSGVQGGANALSGAGAIAASGARQRALQALMAGGALSGQVRGQDQAFQGRKLDASNLIGMFNAGQRWNKAQGVARGWQGMGDIHTGQGKEAKGEATALGAAGGAFGAGLWNLSR